MLFFDSDSPRDEFFTGLYSYDYGDLGAKLMNNKDEELKNSQSDESNLIGDEI